jgi:hypothetical protein
MNAKFFINYFNKNARLTQTFQPDFFLNSRKILKI